MAEWEYMWTTSIELREMDKMKNTDTGNPERSLNKLGLQGWEAYAVIHLDSTVYYLKREIE